MHKFIYVSLCSYVCSHRIDPWNQLCSTSSHGGARTLCGIGCCGIVHYSSPFNLIKINCPCRATHVHVTYDFTVRYVAIVVEGAGRPTLYLTGLAHTKSIICGTHRNMNDRGQLARISKSGCRPRLATLNFLEFLIYATCAHTSYLTLKHNNGVCCCSLRNMHLQIHISIWVRTLALRYIHFDGWESLIFVHDTNNKLEKNVVFNYKMAIMEDEIKWGRQPISDYR